MNNATNGDLIFSETATFKDIENIEINALLSDVIMDATGASVGSVEFRSNINQKNIMVIQNKNDSLVVNVLNLPDKCKVNTASGDIKLDDISSIKARLKTVSGKIFWGGSVHDASIQTVSGDVILAMSTAFKGAIHTRTVSGNVSVPTMAQSGDDVIRIMTISGDIRMANLY